MSYNFVGKTAGQLLSEIPHLRDPADLNNAAQELGRCVGYHALENGGFNNYYAFRKTIELGDLTHQLYDGFANPQLEQRMRKMVNYKVQELQKYTPIINNINKHKSENRTIDRLGLYDEMKNLNKIYQKIFSKKLKKGKIKPDNFAEQYIRNYAEVDSMGLCFALYDKYKKGHGMPHFPYDETFDYAPPQTEADKLFGFK